MVSLTYVNPLGERLIITNSAPFLLQKFTESGNVNVNTVKGVNQDGLTYLGNTLDLKDISIQALIIATDEAGMIRRRNEIVRVFNPKFGEGYLLYKDDIKERKINCIVNGLPFFSKVGDRFTDYKIATGVISLTANNPYWSDVFHVKEEVAIWRGDFEFPLELISGGIEMGHREPSLIFNVVNGGDVECGMRVEFTALATLVNPSLMNVNTLEFVKINKTMVAGEVINITTYRGKKRVESTLNGVIKNNFNFIDLDTTFFQLGVGDNVLRYDAETGIDNLNVSLYYEHQYLGV